MKRFLSILVLILIYANNSFASGASGKALQLHEAKPGDVGGAIIKIKKWYMASDSTIYKIAIVDLNNDGNKEVIVHMSDSGCQRKHNKTCNMFIMKLKGTDNKYWDSISGSIKAKSIKLLNTATQGWRDVMFDNKLYTYSQHGSLGSYSESTKRGRQINKKEPLGTQRIEHFGVSFSIGSDWKHGSQNDKFNSFQSGWANYEGLLPGATQKIDLSIEVSPKKTIEEVFKDHSTDTFKKTKIGQGVIQGHPVSAYYLDTNNGQAGSVYLSFSDEEYFQSPNTSESDIFPMHLYISLSGDMFYGISSEQIQPVLDKYITPFLNSIKITEHNTFKTNTTNENISFRLKYRRKNIDRFTEESSTHNGNYSSDKKMDQAGKESMGTPPDRVSSIKIFKDECLKGDMRGCYLVGRAYFNGEGVAKNLKLGKKFYDLACEGGEYWACVELSRIYQGYEKIEPIDYDKAREYAKLACDHQIGAGCEFLSGLYEEGKGVEKNIELYKLYSKKTHKFFLKNCNFAISSPKGLRSLEKEYGYECFGVGVDYELETNYCAKDIKKAIYYYINGCRLGDYSACNELASIYENGEGEIKIDKKRAKLYYEKGCALKDEVACSKLGMWYEGGVKGIVSKDLKKAKEYYQKACELGDKDACKKLKNDKFNDADTFSEIYILEVIKNGKNGMPPGMALGKDAQDVAKYIANGMKGKKPLVFAVCAACHGDDGRGMDGVGPSLVK